jgi:hypothetical protein
MYCYRSHRKKNATRFSKGHFLTGLTGLEPATSAVTGRCSNQLNYNPTGFVKKFL